MHVRHFDSVLEKLSLCISVSTVFVQVYIGIRFTIDKST